MYYQNVNFAQYQFPNYFQYYDCINSTVYPPFYNYYDYSNLSPNQESFYNKLPYYDYEKLLDIINTKESTNNKKSVFTITKSPNNLSYRKKQSDGIRKKIMSNFLNRAIRKVLNQLLDKYSQTQHKHSLKKLKQTMVNRVNTSFVKNILTKNLREIFIMDNDETNLKIINEYARDNQAFQELLSQNFEIAFKVYLDSEEYFLDKERLMTKECEEYVNIYDEHARNFVSYYKNKKPNKYSRVRRQASDLK